MARGTQVLKRKGQRVRLSRSRAPKYPFRTVGRGDEWDVALARFQQLHQKGYKAGIIRKTLIITAGNKTVR